MRRGNAINQKIWFCIIVITPVLNWLVSDCYGSGFAIYTHDASALGQADAVIAHTDGPASIFFNPALINQLDGTQIQLGTTLVIPYREFKSGWSGETDKTKNTVFYPSTFFITHKFNERLSAGVGVFNPFGLGTEWDDDWEGRYIATRTEMRTYNFNPVISYQATPDFSVAAGVDMLLLDATLERKINLSSFSLPDAGQKFRGNGRGIGYNAGLFYKISDSLSFGASYRSEVKVDIDGEAEFQLPSPLLSSTFPNTDGETDITLPAQLHAGICYKGIENLTVEAALRWEGWSSYDKLEFDFDQPIAGNSTITYDREWKDTYSGSVGMEYDINDTISFRTGYLYGENPVPNGTFEPAIPDSDTHLFTVGSGLRFRNARIDLAYGYQMQQSRNKKNSIDDDPSTALTTATSANGRYNSYIHLVGVSLVYSF